MSNDTNVYPIGMRISKTGYWELEVGSKSLRIINIQLLSRRS